MEQMNLSTVKHKNWKISEALVSYGTISNSKYKREGGKNCLSKSWLNTPKFDEMFKPADPKKLNKPQTE